MFIIIHHVSMNIFLVIADRKLQYNFLIFLSIK